jgi:hypothetical protein
LLLSVPVMVVLPTPTIVATLPEGELITEVLLEVKVVELLTSEPFKVAVNVMVVLEPTAERLMGELGFDLSDSVCVVCPTVTVSVPDMVPFVAVMVTPVVLAMPFTSPVELTVTLVASEVVQVEEAVKLLVLPSSLFPVAMS